MADPKRREQRRTHLDASVVPVERALLARAQELASAAHTTRELDEYPLDVVIATRTERLMAAEFRALAEELHFW